MRHHDRPIFPKHEVPLPGELRQRRSDIMQKHTSGRPEIGGVRRASGACERAVHVQPDRFNLFVRQ
jgi:hypothetical protein